MANMWVIRAIKNIEQKQAIKDIALPFKLRLTGSTARKRKNFMIPSLTKSDYFNERDMALFISILQFFLKFNGNSTGIFLVLVAKILVKLKDFFNLSMWIV